MESIAKLLKATYFLPPNVKLVKSNIVGDNVDCWFESESYTFHRCLTLNHFNFIQSARESVSVEVCHRDPTDNYCYEG